MKKIILFVATTVLFCFQISTTFAQPGIEWQKCLGGIYNDWPFAIQQTLDGGYIVAGFTQSNDGDVSGNHNPCGHCSDYWIVKVNISGSIQWEKCLGGTSDEVANYIEQTNDGGYIIAGYTVSNDGDVSGNQGDGDVWVVKLDSAGNIQKQKCFGGTQFDYASCIHATVDGGYIIAGYTFSNDGDVSGNHGSQDFWLIKINSEWNIQWQKCLGGTQDDLAKSVQLTSDGGYIIAGYTTSNNGDITGWHVGYYGGGIPYPDWWVVKVDFLGNIEWQKCIGGSNDDRANSILQTYDGGYIVAGATKSNNGDVSGNHDVIGINNDFLIVKLNYSGNVQWLKCLGGNGNDCANSIQRTFDNGYIIAGCTNLNGGDVSGCHVGSTNDCWIVQIDSVGNIKWQKCLGGSSNENANCIQQTNDAGYILAGPTYSNNGDVSGNHGGSNMGDYWIVKLIPDLTLALDEIDAELNFNLFPNPVISNLGINLPQKSVIEIINLHGQLLKTINPTENQTTIDISDFARGMYFIKVTKDKGVLTKKFIKE
ncbi:MAG: T9SS type A sorting domain-containing protein [Bacteroidota bacterium]